MSRRNRIVLTPDRGKHFEGIVATSQTFYPGMITQIQGATALQGGRHTCELYNRGADGNRPVGPLIVVTERIMTGHTIDITNSANAYAAGERFFGFIPDAGCELNLYFKNQTGTADDVVAGGNLIADEDSGGVIPTTGSPQDEIAQALESIADPTADALIWAIWNK